MLFFILGAFFIGGQDAAPPLSREETVWREVRVLRDEAAVAPATRPAGATSSVQDERARFDAVRANRQALLERLRFYQTLFPGGAHRDEAVRLELSALFEIGSLSEGQYGPLCARAALYLQNPPSDAVRYEAAYWAMLCERLERGRVAPIKNGTTQPAGISGPDPVLLAAYRRYIEQYPRSPYTPRLAESVFEEALRQKDKETMRGLVKQLAEAFPEHAATVSLQAQWKREEALGQPFALMFQAIDGNAVDTKQFAGKPVLIVVWAGFSPVARERVRQVESFRQAHPEIQVVGVNLDETREDLDKDCRELRIEWPQFHDGLLWANEFARTWGVRQIPYVFVIDRAGRLAGTAVDEAWEGLVQAALRN